MLRYHLDDLGWFQFEWLIQSLLKAECGLLVESWGGSGDYGRDSYSKGKLALLKNSTTNGPFVFQTKFVQNANSSNANSETSIIAAIEREIERIKHRIELKQWSKPNYYILMALVHKSLTKWA